MMRVTPRKRLIRQALYSSQKPSPFPFVEVVTAFQIAVLIFHHVPFVKTQFGFEWPAVHFSDIGAMIARIIQQLDPTPPPSIRVLKNPRSVRVIPLEQACTGGRARGGRDMAIGERNAFANKSIQIRRVHVVIAQRVDSVVTLLVRDNENNIRP